MKKFKNTILAIAVFGLVSAAGILQAQVIIGDDTGTAANKTSVLLEFANTGDRGIILPAVRTLPAATPGTILLDATDPAQAKVMMYNGSWVDLSSENTADITAFMATQPTGITEGTAKTVMGATSSSADGVLVLESTTKAMVLPHVATTDDVINPAPGMMVYVNQPGSKKLAVFNGGSWTFWGAAD